ncbi:uncharacterized protein [Chelonus insularis]|uniref:uncharacterized protein n=1 Tax=Chelonus insularis TaxID=460826 RepID=UPI00158D1521|nr:uncharacterized protein LOC118069615 [Chelonus insularis]
MFPYKTGPVKCNYCGLVVLSAHELLTGHVCHRTIRQRNMAPQSSKIYRPSIIKNTRAEALKTFRLPSIRQTIVKDTLKDVRNDSTANLSKVDFGFRPPITSSQSAPSSSSWISDEILDESEIPIPVLEYYKKDELLSGRNSSLKSIKNAIPKPVTVKRNLPPKSLERSVLPVSLHQPSEESDIPITVYDLGRRMSPVNHKSFTELTSFLDPELLNMKIVPDSKLVPEPLHVMLISSVNKEVTIVPLDDVINELDKRLKELPYAVRLKLEYEFLQNVQEAVDQEQKRTTNII